MIHRQKDPDQKSKELSWHHDPTGTNLKAVTCYGHSWVVLALIIEHPLWGTISLPLQNRLYIRQEDLAKIEASKRPVFKTKLQFLVEMAREVCPLLKTLNIPIQLLFDRGYVSEEVFTEISKLGKDLKEVCGLGKQQVRNLDCNLACFQILTMNYAVVELWAWDKDETYLKKYRFLWDVLNVAPHTRTNTWRCRSNCTG